MGYEKTKKENPGASVAEMGAMLGLKWSELDEGKKEPYRTRSTNAMDEYKAKMATIAADPKFSLQLDQAKLEKTKKMADKAYKKALREKRALVGDLGKPKKKVASAYTAFYTENSPDSTRQEILLPLPPKLLEKRGKLSRRSRSNHTWIVSTNPKLNMMPPI